MTFTIAAELPLGTYQGAAPDGRPEPIPSVVRLHAALLCAAGFGPRAVPDGDGLRPCDADEAALHWLEEHPPDGVVIPEITVSRVEGVAWRNDGTIGKTTTGRLAIKKLSKTPATSVAVAGRLIWSWRDEPPPAVQEALTALCADVPYLGTTESPVRLRADTTDVEATHRLDRDAGMFTLGGQEVEVCRPGRTAELRAAHTRRRARPHAEPKQGYRTDEDSNSDAPPREAVEPVRYMPPSQPSGEVPWEKAILVPLASTIRPQYRVAWAVAIHRALVSLVGEGAPPLLTGVYPPGARRPANRLALHLLDGSAPVAGGVASRGLLAILLPAGAEDDDVAAVMQAVDRLATIRGPRGGTIRVDHRVRIRVVPGARFWVPPEPGRLRLWRTEPAAVPDTRGVRGAEWTFVHAALLSLGFVWKGQLPAVRGRGDEYAIGLARAVTEAGAAVVQARPLRTTNVSAYAHRINDGAVVRPYTAEVWLGDLARPQTVAAIGQSRHLGGGLLVPYDVEPRVRP